MAGAALELLSSPERRAALIRTGLDYVRQFRWEEVRDRLFAIYGEVKKRAR